MEKEMLVVAKFKEGEGKFEKFMGFMQSPEGLAERAKVAVVEKTVASVTPDKSAVMFKIFCTDEAALHKFIGAVAMAIWVGFIRPDGLQGTWAFFNLVFLQNLSAFFVGIYNIKINKLGHTPQTSNEGIIAPGILTLLSAISSHSPLG